MVALFVGGGWSLSSPVALSDDKQILIYARKPGHTGLWQVYDFSGNFRELLRFSIKIMDNCTQNGICLVPANKHPANGMLRSAEYYPKNDPILLGGAIQHVDKSLSTSCAKICIPLPLSSTFQRLFKPHTAASPVSYCVQLFEARRNGKIGFSMSKHLDQSIFGKAPASRASG
jgi:hypothetical protein